MAPRTVVYPPDEQIVAGVREHGSITAAAIRFGIRANTLSVHVRKDVQLAKSVAAAMEEHRMASVTPELSHSDAARAAADDQLELLAENVHALLKRKKRLDIGDLADQLDLSPKRIREALDRLRFKGYRVPPERDDTQVELHTLAPDKTNLHKSLLEGHELRIGLVSDTHLSSNEEALEHLHLAYDTFEEEGITEVLHAGDFTCGKDIFKGQDSEIKNHTFESQVDYLVDNYPKRQGIKTRGITGNHDIEGAFGQVGANPVVAMANRRDDIEFLGDYSAWVELPGGAWIHLLHGKGGMSYAYSYKAQKLVDGYPAGRKPSILAVGHWHVSGNIEARGVQVVWPMCFEWRSKFLERLGLHPAVGFQILNVTVGDDGSVVRWTRETFRFYEGRDVKLFRA